MPSVPRKDDRPIRERAHAHIQQKIINGDLPAGSAISELALSRELGISRTPIREAVGQLVAEVSVSTWSSASWSAWPPGTLRAWV